MLQSGRRRNLLQVASPPPPPPPPPSQEEQTLEQILAAVTALQTGQTALQTDIDDLQTQVNAANAAAAANAQDTSLQVLYHFLPCCLRLSNYRIIAVLLKLLMTCSKF